MTLRQRLVLAVSAITSLTLILFASISIIVIDRTLRGTLDARLLTTAQAIAAATDVRGDRPDPDAGDRAQIASLRNDMHAAILDRAGTIVDGDRRNDLPTARGTQVFSLGRGDDRVRLASAPVIRHGAFLGNVVAWRSDTLINELDRVAALISVLLGLAVIGIGIVITHLLVNAVIAPLHRIAALAERVESGHDLRLRLRPGGNDEIARLGASFDRMLDRLEASFARERRFAADASHELRAPLAVLKAETELALRRDREPQEYHAALRSIANETARLEELVDELLAVARAEVDANERHALDAADIIRTIAERVQPAAAVRNVVVTSTAPRTMIALAQRTTLERALLAILHNAINHARDAGKVELSARRENDVVHIAITDDGPGFSADALSHATERFWRGDAARSRGGTGLGLSIARSLVEANGGTLALSNAAQGGAVVTVALQGA